MARVVNVIVSSHQQKKTADHEGKEGGRAATGSPEAEPEPNYKSICRQLHQKNQQLGKVYQDLKAQFDELQDCQKREEQLAQAQQDADEIADLVLVWQSEQCIVAYKEKLKEKDDRIKALEQQLHHWEILPNRLQQHL